MVKNDSSSLVRLSKFPEDLRQTYCGVTVLPQNQTTICFEVLLPRTTFVGFWCIDFFLAIIRLCGFQEEQTLFTARCSCNSECMLVGVMTKDASFSRQSHGNLAFTVHARHQCSLVQRRCLDD
ncbi:uncharacterized protein LOC131998504 [Stomoxys calcitrans]|uniref:uncharacterized protein LOC131998504 n=1 Tax=Stomoxys calcitrans TaxID=35570 RepID=UPI0027E36C62|nr:uncharacterized protein LOC131998504 [Stomoxys calcitrans]